MVYIVRGNFWCRCQRIYLLPGIMQYYNFYRYLDEINKEIFYTVG